MGLAPRLASDVNTFTATQKVCLGLACPPKVSKVAGVSGGDGACSRIDIECIHIYCYTGCMSRTCLTKVSIM